MWHEQKAVLDMEYIDMDTLTWNTLFTGYGQMRRNGVLANPVGNACSHTTMVDKGQIYCEAMVMSVYLYVDQHARMEEDGGTLGLSQ
mgnify:CR=1 FL=1